MKASTLTSNKYITTGEAKRIADFKVGDTFKLHWGVYRVTSNPVPDPESPLNGTEFTPLMCDTVCLEGQYHDIHRAGDVFVFRSTEQGREHVMVQEVQVPKVTEDASFEACVEALMTALPEVLRADTRGAYTGVACQQDRVQDATNSETFWDIRLHDIATGDLVADLTYVLFNTSGGPQYHYLGGRMMKQGLVRNPDKALRQALAYLGFHPRY